MVLWCFVDRVSPYISMIKTNLMHSLPSVHFVSQPLHVSGTFAAHLQEVYCIYTRTTDSQLTRTTRTNFYTYTLENVVCFKYLGSMLTNDGRCTCEIKSRIVMAKAAFSKKRTLFTSKLDLNLRKKLKKCYIWSKALYGAETWTLRAADQKYLESFEMWCWRRMEKEDQFD